MSIRIHKKDRSLKGRIQLPTSKSISNRVLIIRALCEEYFPIYNLSDAEDTVSLKRLLDSEDVILDAGHGGTTYRFLTAFLAIQPNRRMLTGSSRMLERPIGILVDALQELGASVSYLGKVGYPPIQIDEPKNKWKNELSISASVSSQFISALLLIAPRLPEGLTLRLDGEVVSKPYIQMTLNLMAYFGVLHTWTEHTIHIPPQEYQARPFTVEADWSAASYFYALAALADEVDLELLGLFEDTVQGDAQLVKIMKQFGIVTAYTDEGVQLFKVDCKPQQFIQDFVECPDLAQTFAVLCAAKNVPATLSGLQTLRHKETDRIEALKAELAKFGIDVHALGHSIEVTGALTPKEVEIKTYKDHRMAMAFAPLGLFTPLNFDNPPVVAKSYPQFWKALETLGFEVEK